MPYLSRALLVLLSLGLVGCGPEGKLPALSSGSDEPLPWKAVGSWTGRGNAQLETFPIERQTWRVRWETKNESPAGAGTFYLTANSGDSGRIMAELVDAKGVDGDIAYISDVPHRYYLVVTSSNVEWTVTAEEPLVR